MNQVRHTRSSAWMGSLAFAVAALVGCAAERIEQPITGYTCCNLRSNAGWISSNNVQGGDLVPAGQPVRLTAIKRQFYVYGTLGGIEFGLRDDSARTQGDTLRWLDRIVVKEDPRRQLEQWPTAVRTAVSTGRVFVGMTRAQVAMALGYPSPNDTPALDAPIWRYWAAVEDVPVELHFAPDGTLERLSGAAPAVLSIVLPK